MILEDNYSKTQAVAQHKICRPAAYDFGFARAATIFSLGNLVQNACEAMPHGGVLTITTDLIGADVLIRIADTGIGIPPELLPQLFEPFVTHGKANGTGLGMPIAKSVVEAHRGSMSISSVVGSGTEIRIKVPASAPGV